MNNLQVFDNQEFGQVRVLEKDFDSFNEMEKMYLSI